MDKKGVLKFVKFLFIIALILLIFTAGFFVGKMYDEISGIFFKKTPVKNSGDIPVENLKNPIENIIVSNTKNGEIDKTAVIDIGIKQFNSEYINYILIALGVDSLKKSSVYGNPIVEINLDDEIWKSEVIDGKLKTEKGSVEKKDLIITMSKEEAINALMSDNLPAYMKNSVTQTGKTKITMVSGQMELLSKGYLSIYERFS